MIAKTVLVLTALALVTFASCRYNYDENYDYAKENAPYLEAVEDRALDSLKSDARVVAAKENDSGEAITRSLEDLDAIQAGVDGVVYASLIEAVLSDPDVSAENIAASLASVVKILKTAEAHDATAVASEVRANAAGDTAREAMQNYVANRNTDSIKAMQDSYYRAIEPAEESLATKATVSTAVLLTGSAQAVAGPDSIDATKADLAKAGETLVGDEETETQRSGPQLLALAVEKTTETLAKAESKGFDESAQQATIVSTAQVVNSAGQGMAQVALVVAHRTTSNMIDENAPSPNVSAAISEFTATLGQKKSLLSREAINFARKNSDTAAAQLAILNQLISFIRLPNEIRVLKQYTERLRETTEKRGQSVEEVTSQLVLTVDAVRAAIKRPASGTTGGSTAEGSTAGANTDGGSTTSGEQTASDGKVTKAVTPTATTALSVTERLAGTPCAYQRSTPSGDANGNAAHFADVISNSPENECDSAKNAVDTSDHTRWSADRNGPKISETTPAWIMVKLANATAITSVQTNMESRADSNGFKYDYRVLISPNGTDWELVSSEKERTGFIEFTFSSRQVKYIVVEVTNSSDTGQANIHGIMAKGTYTAPSGVADTGAAGMQLTREGKIRKYATPTTVTAASAASRVTSSGCAYQTSTPTGDANGNVAHFADVVSNSPPTDCAAAKQAVDNSLNSRWSSNRNSPQTSTTTPAWIMVKLSAPTTVARILTAMDSSGSGFGFKYDYQVLISADGSNWELVSSETNRSGIVEFEFAARSVQYIIVEVSKSSDTRQANVHQIEAYAQALN